MEKGGTLTGLHPFFFCGVNGVDKTWQLRPWLLGTGYWLLCTDFQQLSEDKHRKMAQPVFNNLTTPTLSIALKTNVGEKMSNRASGCMPPLLLDATEMLPAEC
jgi:hypothetical protein